MLKPNPAFERTANGGAARYFNQGERRRCLPLNANVGPLMQHPYFDRFQSTGTMMQAEQELLELGDAAIPVLRSLFSGEARNEFGVPYRNLGLPLRCGIEVASRLGAVAKPLESYLRDEAKGGNHVAAMALGSLGALELQTVEVLAQSLCGDLDLASESARALILCREGDSSPVVQALTASKRAASMFSKISGFCLKENKR